MPEALREFRKVWRRYAIGGRESYSVRRRQRGKELTRDAVVAVLVAELRAEGIEPSAEAMGARWPTMREGLEHVRQLAGV